MCTQPYTQIIHKKPINQFERISMELKRVKRTDPIVQFTKTYAFNDVVDLFLLSSISKNGRYYLIRVKVIIKFSSHTFYGYIMLINYNGIIKTVQNQCEAKINL